MEIVPSTLIALAALAAMLWRGPARAIGVFLALTPFGAAAAFNLPAVGGATIGVADLGAIALFGLLCLTPAGLPAIAGTMRPGLPGFWLMLLTAWCVLSALFMPRVFAGQTEVFTLSREANAGGIAAISLGPTTGNLTQLFRMLLGVCVFLAMATLMRLRPDPGRVIAAMALATAIHALLGLIDVASAAAGAPQLLDPIRTANYAILSEHYMVGVKRMVGGFPEASSFGTYSLGLFAFWAALWVSAPHLRLAPWMAGLTGLLLLRSTSSGAYVALVVFIVSWGLWRIAARLRARAARRSIAIFAGSLVTGWIALVALFAAYQFAEPITAYLDRLLFAKLETTSGVERMSWNAQAWQNFIDTMGMGAGLGAVRGSNWLLATLGSLGAIGTALFFAFLVSVMRAPRQSGDAGAVIAALKAGCLALFLSAMLTGATPDLGLVFAAFAGLAAGLSRGTIVESQLQSRQQRGILAPPHVQ